MLGAIRASGGAGGDRGVLRTGMECRYSGVRRV